MAGYYGKAFEYKHSGGTEMCGEVTKYGFLCYLPQEEEHDELILAGIDPERMGYLSGRERRRILEKAGLNPREYDF